MIDPEIRVVESAEAEVRLDEAAGGRPVIRGIAVPYNRLSHPMRMPNSRAHFRERFAPGAFTRALADGVDVVALVNHDPNHVLGRTSAGTLRLIDGPDALRYEIDPSDSLLADHHVKAVARRDMKGSSFRFYMKRDLWSVEDGQDIRTVAEAGIDDVSVVTYPAYEDTSAALRSFESHRRGQPRRDAWPTLARMRLRLAEAAASS